MRWASAGWWLSLAGIAMALVLIPFFIELTPTRHLVEGTSYPGARRATGGALRFDQLFLGFAEPFFSAGAYPEQRGSICGAANFFPVWIAAGCWLFLGWGDREQARRRQLYPLLGTLLALTFFALCPLPGFIGRITLLSFSTEERLILPIGLGGILLSVLVLREMKAPAPAAGKRRWIALVLCAAFDVTVLLANATASPRFFTDARLAGAIALSILLLALYLWPMKRAFALVLLAALLPPATQVNPVTCGLAPLTQSSAVAINEIRKADPEARWLAFDGANQSSFLMACGVNVLSGAKTLPDLTFYGELDPQRRDLAIYNRYSLGLFQITPDPARVSFELFNFCSHRVLIHPANPALQSRNVRYFVFPHALENPASYGLQIFKSVPERGLWIYCRASERISSQAF